MFQTKYSLEWLAHSAFSSLFGNAALVALLAKNVRSARVFSLRPILMRFSSLVLFASLAVGQALKRVFGRAVLTYVRRQIMFEKTMVRGLLVVAAAAAMLGGTAMADAILPTDFPPGVTQYQIAFLTDATTSGTSGSESTYNSLVQSQASALGGLVPGGTSWHAITSTSNGTTYVDASANAPAYANVPIYNTAGQLFFFSDIDSIYQEPDTNTGTLEYDQYGNLFYTLADEYVWTGGLEDGYQFPLGVDVGDPGYSCAGINDGTGQWWAINVEASSASYPIYALSSPINVVPEPASPRALGRGTSGTWRSLSAAAQGEGLTTANSQPSSPLHTCRQHRT